MAISYRKGMMTLPKPQLFTVQEKCKALSVPSRIKLLATKHPEVLSNDRLLFNLYYREFHNIDTFEEYCNNLNCPTLESLRRVRQKLTSAGR